MTEDAVELQAELARREKAEHLRMDAVHAAELEMENARRAMSEAHLAYALAKRKLKKAQAAYFASRAYSVEK
jgi:hypothetical protein